MIESQLGCPVLAPEPMVWVCTRELGGRELLSPCFATNHDYVRAHPNHNWKAMYPMTFMGRLVLVEEGGRVAVEDALIRSVMQTIHDREATPKGQAADVSEGESNG